jgi:hypothetical protein
MSQVAITMVNIYGKKLHDILHQMMKKSHLCCKKGGESASPTMDHRACSAKELHRHLP